MAFPSREAYERLIYSLADSYPEIRSSSLHLYPNSSTTCFVRGSVWFQNGLELRVFEYLDLSDGELLGYSYTVLKGEDRIRWYDPQPHPEVPELHSTFPHHYHVLPEPGGSEPGIKHNRHPAPGISFEEPNLPTLIADVAELSPVDSEPI
jgi:hypothetical protein